MQEITSKPKLKLSPEVKKLIRKLVELVEKRNRILASMGSLIEMFLSEQGIKLAKPISTTQEAEKEASAQVDASYCIGQSKPVPDFSIEVVFNSEGKNKLEKCQAIGVPEIWLWQDGVFSFYRLHRLRRKGYEQIDRTEIPEFTALNFELLSRCALMAENSGLEAIQAFRKGS
jgi:Uma2 family endonuclease